MSADITPGLSPWQRALRVAALCAVAPCNVVLRAPAGVPRARWLEALRALLPEATPWRTVPVHVPVARLSGGLDLGATLAAGRPCLERGLLAAADGGVLILNMAERMNPVTAGVIAAALDDHAVRVEREGVSAQVATRFVTIALDEGVDIEERAPSALRERAALLLDLGDIQSRKLEAGTHDRDSIALARAVLTSVTISADIVQALTAAAHEVGIRSLRPVLHALKVARAAAALDGEREVSQHHAALAAQLVLAPRAEALPVPPPDGDAAAPERREQSRDPRAGDEHDNDCDAHVDEARELVVAAAQAAIPDALLRQLALGSAPRRSAGGGRAGVRAESRQRGRPLAARAGKPGADARLSVVDTLRAAAPWQRLRRAQRASTAVPAQGAARIDVRSDDFRVTRFQQRQQTVTIFVVDTSGSTAMQRLAEAKGAVEIMLSECYVRRDKVALIAFGGSRAAVVLAPTRALTRAKRCLAELPGGGGSPLASGMVLARDLALAARREDATPVVVLMTDGRANVCLAGRGGVEDASRDALAAARDVAALGVTALLIDVAARPREFASRLATTMGARYLPLPNAGANTIAAMALAAPGAALALPMKGAGEHG